VGARAVSVARRLPALRVEFLWVAGAQFASLVAGLFAITVLTKLLGPEGYGKFALGLSIVGVLNLLIYGPVAQTASRFYAITSERGEIARFLVLTQRTYVVATGVVLLVIALGAIVVKAAVGGAWAGLFAGSGLMGIAAGATAVLAAALNAMRLRRAYALQQATEAMLKPLLAAGLVLAFSCDPNLALVGYALASILVAIPVGRVVRDGLLSGPAVTKSATRSGTPLTREMLAYGGPFVVFGLVAVVGMFGDRWLLLAWSGAEVVGVYAAMYQLANAPIALALGVVNQFSLPIIFQKAGTLGPDQAREGKRLYRYVILASVAMIAAFVGAAYLFAEPILRTLMPEAFIVHHDAFWIITMGIAFFHFGQQLVVKGFYLKRTGAYMLPKAMQSASFLILAFALGAEGGVRGIATAFAVSALLYVALVLLANRRF
jgi:stage V sporulation protein B